jgi:hypothetical protein
MASVRNDFSYLNVVEDPLGGSDLSGEIDLGEIMASCCDCQLSPM